MYVVNIDFARPQPTLVLFEDLDYILVYHGCTVRPRVVLAGSFPYTIAMGYLVEPVPCVNECIGRMLFSHSLKLMFIRVFIVFIERPMDILSCLPYGFDWHLYHMF